MSRLENLKPMPKTILPRLETPVGFQRRTEIKESSGFKISAGVLNLEDSLTPINVKTPVGPDLRLLLKLSGSEKIGSLKSPGSSNLLKSYNSLMNKLEPKVVIDLTEVERIEPINPLILEEIRSEEEDLNPLNPKKHILKAPILEEPKSLGIFKPFRPVGSESSKILDPSSLKKLSKVLEDDPLNPSDVIQPVFLQAKDEDLDEECIECINLSKKDCKVIEYKTGKILSYGKARENTDYMLIKLEDKFYSYSKKDIYEQYMKCHSQMYFHLKVSKDSEIFWIPMIQVVRVLEYSHPMYEIEKTKFSMNLYNLKAIKLLRS